MISLIHVWKWFGDAAALKDVSLEVRPGEAALITGPSGAGKSTLLRLLYAAERADEGQVLVAGRDVARLQRSSLPFLRRNLGVIFQHLKIINDRTVRENIALALEAINISQSEIRPRVEAALATVGLERSAGRACAELSAGERQRVAVARAIVGTPAVLLADEPTAHLDPLLAVDVLAILEGQRRGGASVIVAAHDPDAIRFADAHGWRRFRLDGGELLDMTLAAPAAPLEGDATERTRTINLAPDHGRSEEMPPPVERPRADDTPTPAPDSAPIDVSLEAR